MSVEKSFGSVKHGDNEVIHGRSGHDYVGRHCDACGKAVSAAGFDSHVHQ